MTDVSERSGFPVVHANTVLENYPPPHAPDDVAHYVSPRAKVGDIEETLCGDIIRVRTRDVSGKDLCEACVQAEAGAPYGHYIHPPSRRYAACWSA